MAENNLNFCLFCHDVSVVIHVQRWFSFLHVLFFRFISGANTGIGKATAENLAKRGARVILACRNKEKGIAAEKEVKEAGSSEEVRFMKLDLASFKSIRSFVDEFSNNENRLDILVNNAGISGKSVHYYHFSNLSNREGKR